MEYNNVVEAITFLQQTHPRYKACVIASKDECEWDRQTASVHGDPVIIDDNGSRVHEAQMTSDIAEGWDPKCRVMQSKGSPNDSDFGSVMCMRTDGMTRDPASAVRQVLQTVREAKAKAQENKSVVRIGDTPMNEFTDFPVMLSGAFPTEFPLGVTADDLGGNGPLKNGVLQRLLKFYDGRVAKNHVLHLWLTNMKMRHRALASTSAYAKKESQERLIHEVNKVC